MVTIDRAERDGDGRLHLPDLHDGKLEHAAEGDPDRLRRLEPDRHLVHPDPHTASGGGYGSVTASLSVTVEEDDGPVQAHIASGGIVSLTEGGSHTYRISLANAPTENVTVAVTAPSQVNVNPTSLTFTTGNWSTPQSVALEALHDTDTSNETQYVTHRATKGDYTTTLRSVQVEIEDDDQRGVADRLAAVGCLVVGGADRAAGDRRVYRAHRLHGPRIRTPASSPTPASPRTG